MKVLALISTLAVLSQAHDDTAFLQTVLTGMCRRIASVKRDDIVIGGGLEKGSSESVAIPILASLTHVLFDLYDESKVSGQTLNQFVAKCDYSVALVLSSSQFADVKKNVAEVVYNKYFNQLQKICAETPKLKHFEVSKIASDLVENLGTSPQIKGGEMKVKTERVLHILIIRYNLAKAERQTDGQFIMQCKNLRKLLLE